MLHSVAAPGDLQTVGACVQWETETTVQTGDEKQHHLMGLADKVYSHAV